MRGAHRSTDKTGSDQTNNRRDRNPRAKRGNAISPIMFLGEGEAVGAFGNLAHTIDRVTRQDHVSHTKDNARLINQPEYVVNISVEVTVARPRIQNG